MENKIEQLPQDTEARKRMNMFAVSRGYFNWEDMHGQSADCIEELTEELVQELLNELEEAKDIIHDCYQESCFVDTEEGYDHMCMSAYETAQRYLIEHGIIDQKHCKRP